MFSKAKLERTMSSELGMTVVILHFVNGNIVIMSIHFLTHKTTFIKVNQVKIVFIGYLKNRIMGLLLIKHFGTM